MEQGTSELNLQAQGRSTQTEIQSVVERYLVDKYFRESNRKIDPSESLFSLGFLDSLAFVQLISFIEGEFKIIIDDADVVAENFQSLEAISGLVSGNRS